MRRNLSGLPISMRFSGVASSNAAVASSLEKASNWLRTTSSIAIASAVVISPIAAALVHHGPAIPTAKAAAANTHLLIAPHSNQITNQYRKDQQKCGEFALEEK